MLESFTTSRSLDELVSDAERMLGVELTGPKTVRRSDALAAGNDDRFGDREALSTFVEQRGDVVLYTAYRDIFPSVVGKEATEDGVAMVRRFRGLFR